MFTKDWALAKAFAKLEAITLCADPSFSIHRFFLDLEQLSGLKHLSVRRLDAHGLDLKVPFPIGLESLKLYDCWSDDELSPLFSSFQQLTHFELKLLKGRSSLTVLTGLKELQVETAVGDDAVDDWTTILVPACCKWNV